MKIRSLVAFATTVVILSIATASAATLGTLTTDDLGAGGDDVGRCDTNGFTFNFTLVENNVTEVTVAGINSACDGGHMTVVLASAAGSNIGDGTDSSVGSPSESVTINEAPPAANVDDVHVVIEGGS